RRSQTAEQQRRKQDEVIEPLCAGPEGSAGKARPAEGIAPEDQREQRPQRCQQRTHGALSAATGEGDRGFATARSEGTLRILRVRTNPTLSTSTVKPKALRDRKSV